MTSLKINTYALLESDLDSNPTKMICYKTQQTHAHTFCHANNNSTSIEIDRKSNEDHNRKVKIELQDKSKRL